MIRTVKFDGFKALQRFSISFRQHNVLVGPNNAGKSTVLDAFRALSGALTASRRTLPLPLPTHDQAAALGWRIPESAIPIATKNISSNLREAESLLTFVLANGRELRLRFAAEGPITLEVSADHYEVTSLQKIRKLFPIDVRIVPVLGPAEEEEPLVTDEYYKRWWQSRRSSRLFRNIWHRQDDKTFSAFAASVSATWPGVTIEKPETTGYAPAHLRMFIREGRLPRELAWSGFGLQVWLQFMTHLALSPPDSLVVIDEPDIYLHPSLQRKLYHLLAERQGATILATHSTEIINEADPEDLLVVDKSQRKGKRLRDVDQVQALLSGIGSAQNIHLSRLSQGRRILFVEGSDYGILKRFARQLGLREITSGENLTCFPLGGFSNAARLENAAWAFSEILKADIRIAVVLDRDFRCDEEIRDLCGKLSKSASIAHVHSRKEIENYLLEVRPLTAAINERLGYRDLVVRLTEEDVAAQLTAISSSLEGHCRSRSSASYLDHHHGSKQAAATLLQVCNERFDNMWRVGRQKLSIVPGKEILSKLNSNLQGEYGVSVTAHSIIAKMSKLDVADDLCDFLIRLEEFAR